MSACDDETACEFVSSRGLLKSCQVRSMNPKSSCPSQLEYIADFIAAQNDYKNDRAPSPPSLPVSIYVCCDAFQSFIQAYAPHINVPYVVVCGDGDLTMFRETVSNHPNQAVLFMLHHNLRGLYSQNMDIKDCRNFLKEKIQIKKKNSLNIIQSLRESSKPILFEIIFVK